MEYAGNKKISFPCLLIPHLRSILEINAAVRLACMRFLTLKEVGGSHSSNHSRIATFMQRSGSTKWTSLYKAIIRAYDNLPGWVLDSPPPPPPPGGGLPSLVVGEGNRKPTTLEQDLEFFFCWYDSVQISPTRLFTQALEYSTRKNENYRGQQLS
jgi:hypothetical protein